MAVFTRSVFHSRHGTYAISHAFREERGLVGRERGEANEKDLCPSSWRIEKVEIEKGVSQEEEVEEKEEEEVEGRRHIDAFASFQKKKTKVPQARGRKRKNNLLDREDWSLRTMLRSVRTIYRMFLNGNGISWNKIKGMQQWNAKLFLDKAKLTLKGVNDFIVLPNVINLIIDVIYFYIWAFLPTPC